MANRIPPSLSWLIEKRARVDGEMKKTQQALNKVTRLLKKLEAAEDRLKALDAVIAEHPLTQEPKRAGPFNIEHHRRLPLPKGEMTRCILDCLGEAKGQPVKRAELHAFIFARYPQFDTTDYYRRWIKEVVKDRLKTLIYRNVVQRHHDRRTRQPGIWSLVEQ